MVGRASRWHGSVPATYAWYQRQSIRIRGEIRARPTHAPVAGDRSQVCSFIQWMALDAGLKLNGHCPYRHGVNARNGEGQRDEEDAWLANGR